MVASLSEGRRAEALHLLRRGAGKDALRLFLGEPFLHGLGCVDAAVLPYADVHQSGRPSCLCLSWRHPQTHMLKAIAAQAS